MSAEIILFDLPSRAGKAWSLNPWKSKLLLPFKSGDPAMTMTDPTLTPFLARLALNYKGLPYRTEWIEYPDLRPTFQGL